MTGLNLSEWALTHRSLTIFLMIVAVGAGVMSYFRLGRSEDPSFVIKTMVVQAAWPGATAEETLKQVTERLERTLQETPRLDFLRSFTRAGVTTIFVNLQGNTPAKEVPDIWYHVRKSISDMRATLPLGVVGPGFNDEFGDTFGIIYGFTAEGFTHRELRDFVEDVRSKILHVPDVSKIEILGAQDEKIFVEFSVQQLASLGIDRSALIAALQAQNVVQPAGTIQTGDEALAAMADSYTRLLDDRTLLLLQMQIYAACSDPEIRDATRAAYKRLWEMVERITGLPFQTVVDFFAVGMLMNVAAALDLPSVDERWTSWCPKD